MTERPDLTTSKPTQRDSAYGIGFVGVFLALVIAVPGVFLVASRSCGCASPVDVVVLNLAHEDATVSWQGAGLLGTPILGIAGSDTAPACTATSETLRPGAVDVTLRAGGDAQTFRVDVPGGEGRSSHVPIIVIGADGHIQGQTGGSPSLDPNCN
jgi:hypothetical protein